MMGYLGRLWANSTRRQPALRPLADSIYGAMHAAAPGPVFATRIAAAPHPQEPGAYHEPGSIPGSFPGSIPTARATEASEKREPERNAKLQYQNYVPLLPPTEPDAFFAMRVIPKSDVEVRSIGNGTRSAESIHRNDLGGRRLEVNFVAERQGEGNKAVRADADLRDAAEPGGLQSHHAQTRMVPHPHAEIGSAGEAQAPARQSLLPGTPSASAREAMRTSAADESGVQIHIGRIEVIAVPPPQTQLQPKRTTSRTSSLADYLSRRNGSNR